MSRKTAPVLRANRGSQDHPWYNCLLPDVYASLESQGVEIINPFKSSCGRFEAEPTEYGFEVKIDETDYTRWQLKGRTPEGEGAEWELQRQRGSPTAYSLFVVRGKRGQAKVYASYVIKTGD